MILEFTIPLVPRTKKNSNVKTRSGGIIASKAYRQYECDALKIIPHWARKKIDKPCHVTTVFFMPDNRRVDIGNLINAAHDVMVAAGVMQDDARKYIPSIDAAVRTDKKHPRTEIRIEVIE